MKDRSIAKSLKSMRARTVTKNPETADVIGNIVTFPMMFLASTFFPISIMAEYLQSMAHVLPLFYIIEGLNNVMVYGNYDGALIDLAVVAVMTVVIFLAAIRLFKWREDYPGAKLISTINCVDKGQLMDFALFSENFASYVKRMPQD